MDTERGARAGGAFAWKTGAWFGAQVGSTLWLVVLGIVLSLRDDSSPGTAIIALAVAANGIGLLLWEHRDAIRPYPAIQALIGVAACAALVAIVLIDGTSAWGLGGSEAANVRPPYAVLLVFPAMMGFCALQEHAARRARRARRRGPHGPLADGTGRR